MPVVCNICGGEFDGAGPGKEWPHDTRECARVTPSRLHARIAVMTTALIDARYILANNELEGDVRSGALVKHINAVLENS